MERAKLLASLGALMSDSIETIAVRTANLAGRNAVLDQLAVLPSTIQTVLDEYTEYQRAKTEHETQAKTPERLRAPNRLDPNENLE